MIIKYKMSGVYRLCFILMFVGNVMIFLYRLPSLSASLDIKGLLEILELRLIYMTLYYLFLFYIPVKIIHFIMGKRITSEYLKALYQFIVLTYMMTLVLLIMSITFYDFPMMIRRLFFRIGPVGRWIADIFHGDVAICIVFSLMLSALLVLLYFGLMRVSGYIKDHTNGFLERLKPIYYMFLVVIVISFSHQIIASAVADKESRAADTHAGDSNSPPVIFIVFDAFSAGDSDLYGYVRPTTPNLKKFADQSHFYEYNFSASVVTGPSTASLLSGHNVLHHGLLQATWLPPVMLGDKNYFSEFKKIGYRTVAYTHNPMAELVLREYINDIDNFVPFQKLYADVEPFCYAMSLFMREGTYLKCISRNVRSSDFFRLPNYLSGLKKIEADYVDKPRYYIEQLFDWVIGSLESDSDLSVFYYVHAFPPHDPYDYDGDFGSDFRDTEVPVLHLQTKAGISGAEEGRHVIRKALGDLSSVKYTEDDYKKSRLAYGRLIATADNAFGKFINKLKELGLYDRSYIIVTSDHGEMFRNDLIGHGWYMYNDLNRVPLIIKEPYQKNGFRHSEFTSSVDIMPSIIKRLKGTSDTESDGQILPGFTGRVQRAEPIMTVVAGGSKPFDRDNIHIALMSDPYKYIYYQENDAAELYNIRKDPFEINDISSARPGLEMQFRKKAVTYIEEHADGNTALNE